MRTLLLHFALLTALAAALLTGCAKKGYDYSTAPSYGYAESEADYYYEDDAEDMGGSGWGSRAAASEPMAPPMMARATAAPEAAEPEPDAAPAQQAARMVHYNGYVLLRATRPEEVVAEAVAMAEAMGGYVERRTLSSATLRVPVVEFKAAFDGLAELGDVLDKSMTAQDVTEAFTSVALRLKTARETRARLQELLARAVDEAEKLALLQEIQRLTEEIDLLDTRSRTLSQLASYSRLSLDVQARDPYAGGYDQDELSGFDWIRQLSPFRRDVAFSGKLVKSEVPEGMVALDIKKHFVAESADGAVFWTGRLPNDPQGDTDFWMAAIQERLAPEFEEVTTSSVGDYAVLRLVEPGAEEDPYRYLVALRAEGRWLTLVEIYYPGAEQEERYHPSVVAALTGSRS